LALALALLLHDVQRGWAMRFASCAAAASSSAEPRTVVLVGATGSGKSNLANFLTGNATLFATGDSGTSVTKEAQVERGFFFNNPTLGTVEVVDTPGLQDTEGVVADKIQWDKVVEKLTKVVKQAHALVLVLSGPAIGRWTNEVTKAMKQLRVSFGQDFWRSLYIIVTRAKLSSDTEEEIRRTRKFMLQTEEQIVGVGYVNAAIREKIEKLPVYRLDMDPNLLDEQKRRRTFTIKRARDLVGFSLGEVIQLDQELKAECSRNGFAYFDDWSAEDEKLEDKLVDRRGIFSWG